MDPDLTSSAIIMSAPTLAKSNYDFEIFIKLPVKTLMKIRALSRYHNKLITSSIFVRHYEHRVGEDLGLLITCSDMIRNREMFYRADLDGGNAVHHLTTSKERVRYITPSINGIVCIDYVHNPTLVNPSVNRTVELPVIAPSSEQYYSVNAFGYDQTRQQYIVLNARAFPVLRKDTEYRICKIGPPENLEWRLLERAPKHPYIPQPESVWIDGFIYFRAWANEFGTKAVLMKFNVENEELTVIALPDNVPQSAENSDLIEFAGRVGIVDREELNYRNYYTIWAVDGDLDNDDDDDEDEEMADADEPEEEEEEGPEVVRWAEYPCRLPDNWPQLRGNQEYHVPCMTDRGLLIAPLHYQNPLHVFHHDIAEEEITHVEITGMPNYNLNEYYGKRLYFTMYEENIRFLDHR